MRLVSDNNVEAASEGNSSGNSKPTLPAAELCCQTGCSSCVFLIFADELLEYCKKTGKDPRTELNSLTSDVTLRGMIDMLIKEAEASSD